MNFNYIGKLSISNFSKKVKNINSWEDYQFRQKTYEVHKYTKTIPLIFDEDFKHKDPTYHKQYNNYKEEIEKIKKVFTKKFGQGYIIRAILVNLPAQKIIPEHIDETKNLKVGEMWEINNSKKPHSVENNSKEDRVHLIIDWVINDK
mgnify:CR=1 FL=1